jgi:two-component system response regulator YesN
MNGGKNLMYKVMIVDDEELIREGISESLDWKSMGMEIAGLAGDGDEALLIAAREKPDICLIDIHMPNMDGLSLITKLNKENPNAITIIVSGHDEFEYAQKAVQLNVFDYLLKPVVEKELQRVVSKAKERLDGTKIQKKWFDLANDQLKRNLPFLMNSFISSLLNGDMTKEETDELLQFHGVELGESIGLVLIKTQGATFDGRAKSEWEKQLLLFAIQNIIEEVLKPLNPSITIRDQNENLVSIVTIKDLKNWKDMKLTLENSVEKYIKHVIQVYQSGLLNGLDEVSDAYEEIKKAMYVDAKCHPVIKMVKQYAEKHYTNPELRIQTIADNMGMSINHLSMLFKQEMGVSYIEYLIKYRMSKAISLLEDPMLKIYEVAEQVGYKGQHYFCAAFKKVLGISPTEYRQRMNRK